MADLFITPRLTEKSHQLATEGIYVFNVPAKANKYQVKQAINEQYDVKVANVSIISQKGKAKPFNRGKNRYPGVRYENDTKKAYVTLVEGQKLSVFETETTNKEESK